MPAKLTYRDKEGRNVSFTLAEEGAVVGRAERCALRINHPTVSSTHCHFTLIDGKWHVEDLGSTNGTFLNRRRLDRNVNTAIAHRDQIACGSLKIRFLHPEEKTGSKDAAAAAEATESPEAEAPETESEAPETETAGAEAAAEEEQEKQEVQVEEAGQEDPALSDLRREVEQIRADNGRLHQELLETRREHDAKARSLQEAADRLMLHLRQEVQQAQEEAHGLREQVHAGRTQIKALQEQLASARAHAAPPAPSFTTEDPPHPDSALQERYLKAQREIRSLRAELLRLRMLSGNESPE